MKEIISLICVHSSNCAYQQAKNTMKSQSGNPKCQGSGELTLLDFLEAAEGKIGILLKRSTLAGGAHLSARF